MARGREKMALEAILIFQMFRLKEKPKELQEPRHFLGWRARVNGEKEAGE